MSSGTLAGERVVRAGHNRHRVWPEPAIGPAKGRTRWAGPMINSAKPMPPPYPPPHAGEGREGGAALPLMGFAALNPSYASTSPYAVLLTPQKNGSGPLITPETFFRH